MKSFFSPLGKDTLPMRLALAALASLAALFMTLLAPLVAGCRRGCFMSTTGSFQLSSGGGGAGGAFGNGAGQGAGGGFGGRGRRL